MMLLKIEKALKDVQYNESSNYNDFSWSDSVAALKKELPENVVEKLLSPLKEDVHDCSGSVKKERMRVNSYAAKGVRSQHGVVSKISEPPRKKDLVVLWNVQTKQNTKQARESCRVALVTEYKFGLVVQFDCSRHLQPPKEKIACA